MSTEVPTQPNPSSEPPTSDGERRWWHFLTAGPPVRKPVFVSSVVGVLVMAIWAMVAPERAEAVLGDTVGWVVDVFGWFYVALTTVVLVFVLYLALSRYGRIKLGPDHSKPQFSTFAWASMLFAAGIGTDVMFFAVAEPVSQYMAPPTGDAETIEAAREATVWTLFHYGISGWALYALMGLALGYFTYRLNLPLAVRSALYPIFGKRIDGGIGHVVDTAAVLGTIFGVATSLGIGVVFLNQGLNILFDVPVGLGAQIALIVLAVAMAAISATTGIDKGIRLLSQLNVILALGLAAWVLITGRTSFILNAIVMNVGDYVQTFATRTMETFAFEGAEATEWMSFWTLFFWAWWIAWASFVGLFLARISRGRTIGQFVAGTMLIPFSYILMWISIFGNAALDRIREGDADFAETALASPEAGFYDLLESYPLSGVVIFVSVLVGLLFYVTSADSGALVMANLSSRLRSVQDDAAPWLRIVWASATGLLTIAVLAVGGIYALQYATVIFGLPFAFVIVLVMVGFMKALRVEGRWAASGEHALPLMLSARGGFGPDHESASWKARLSRAVDFAEEDEAVAFQDSVVTPALEQVAAQLEAEGVPSGVSSGVGDGDDETEGGRLPWVELRTTAERPFVYRVQLTESPVPTYGGRMIGDRDRYARLEVHTADGGQDYDVMGYSTSQIIHDCLDQYERHLEFLRLA
ncbi:choline/glycine/proline betaine transport protein [Mumia flava]|uniref:Choline/glycine/proline betaine transport protein n=1 Tax=Mumia flava TaxID=1348852 RepID=A0A2M9BII9_9ACTN|nr:choline BCCT transporter BetT [Mumia flava]PJJ57768.1 choline/glycine/proline betaine transport protein [Mumia flava]